MKTVRIPPFECDKQLVADGPQGSIPNAPLLSPIQTDIDQFLAEELDTVVLNKLYPYLFLVATKSWSHIYPLSEHINKGREIVVTEDPALHLVWYYKTLYLKPLPHCLLNYNFWKEYISRQRQQTEYDADTLSVACRAALGFVRSYTRLIRHESDFLLAREKHLVPKEVKFQDLLLFINAFKAISDEAVAPRYHYGQIRLSRLNVAVWLFPPRSWYYFRLDWQIGHYFNRWAAPLFFIWASTNLVLSSMQVVHNSRGTDTWAVFNTASWIFATATLGLMATMTASVLIVILVVYGKQLWFAIRTFMKVGRSTDTEKNAAN